MKEIPNVTKRREIMMGKSNDFSLISLILTTFDSFFK